MNNNDKISDLKDKLKEKKLLDKMRSDNTVEITPKIMIKNIKKMNNSPKGIKLIDNTVGNIIDFKGAYKTYIVGSTPYEAFKHNDFTIKKGEFVVILGQSGSGKSTLLNIMSGLDRPTGGQIVVDGINIAALTTSELTTFRRNKVGYVFQSNNLLPELNAFDNVQLGAVLQTDGNKRLDINDLFEKMDITDKMNSGINNLSGGQAQRVSIIRALAKNPDIIFADEPTGALDSKSSDKVIELFKTINKKYKTTILLVTHNEDIAKAADKVLYVKDGKVEIKYNTRS